MAFASDGSIYLTDSDRIRRIEKSGKVTTIYDPQKSPIPTDINSSSKKLYGLAVCQQNNVFIADFGNQKLLKNKL